MQEKENKLIGRKEIITEILGEGKPTPRNEEVRKQLAAQLKTDENAIAIKKISQAFGGGKVTVHANVYKDEKSLAQYEKINKKQKAKPAEAAPVQQPPPKK